MPPTKWVEIIDKKEFTKAAFDENFEAFIVYITSFSLNSMLIYTAKAVQIALLIAEKVKISTDYLDFSNVFSEKKAFVIGSTQYHTTRLNRGRNT